MVPTETPESTDESSVPSDHTPAADEKPVSSEQTPVVGTDTAETDSAVPAEQAPIASDSQSWARTWRDIRDGFGQRELWLSLGWQDIKQRYRRSVIGPFWITIATAVQATAIGILYAALFGQPLRDYLPYVAVGLIVWNVINASITEGADVFIANEGLIKQLPSALSVHVFRLVWRQMLFFAHNLAIYLIILPVFGVWQDLHWTVVFALPALALLFLNAMWVSVLFGIFSTRYRDIAPILGSMTLMLFVLTPVMWSPRSLEGQGGDIAERARLAELVPTYHYLEIVRAPLLGDDQKLYHWVIVGGITVVGWIAAAVALKKYRSRVPYWV